MQFSTIIYVKNQEVDNLRKEISEKFNTKQSIQQWGLHITIGSGIEVSEEELESLRKELKEVANNFESFKVSLKDFGYMDTWEGLPNAEPYVAYMDVLMNDNLKNFHEKVEKILGKYNKWYEVKEYIPHLTLAYDDLTKENFEKIKIFLKDYKGMQFEFIVDSFSLALHAGRYDERKEYIKFNLKK